MQHTPTTGSLYVCVLVRLAYNLLRIQCPSRCARVITCNFCVPEIEKKICTTNFQKKLDGLKKKFENEPFAFVHSCTALFRVPSLAFFF